ncbi:hypothetical protein IC615_11585 [Serratia ureilytica]
MTDNNAAFIQYADLRNKNWSLQERLNIEGIYVSSRDELVGAQDFIIKTLKRPAIVRFAAPFALWTAPKTDINVGFVYIDGNGVNVTTEIPTARKATITISCAAIPATARWITTFLFARRLS